MPARDPGAAAAARRSAPWGLVLLIAGSAAIALGLVLHSTPIAVAAGVLLVAGTLLLGWTALRGGRGDEPRVPAASPTVRRRP